MIWLPFWLVRLPMHRKRTIYTLFVSENHLSLCMVSTSLPLKKKTIMPCCKLKFQRALVKSLGYSYHLLISLFVSPPPPHSFHVYFFLDNFLNHYFSLILSVSTIVPYLFSPTEKLNHHFLLLLFSSNHILCVQSISEVTLQILPQQPTRLNVS